MRKHIPYALNGCSLPRVATAVHFNLNRLFMDTFKKAIVVCTAIAAFLGGTSALLSSMDTVLASRVNAVLTSKTAKVDSITLQAGVVEASDK